MNFISTAASSPCEKLKLQIGKFGENQENNT